jgi:hypothetical protein
MVRASDFVDPDYDRRLAEFKRMKAEMKQQTQGESQPSSSSSNSQRRY